LTFSNLARIGSIQVPIAQKAVYWNASFLGIKVDTWTFQNRYGGNLSNPWDLRYRASKSDNL
jgi:hypothetical protein